MPRTPGFLIDLQATVRGRNLHCLHQHQSLTATEIQISTSSIQSYHPHHHIIVTVERIIGQSKSEENAQDLEFYLNDVNRCTKKK